MSDNKPCPFCGVAVKKMAMFGDPCVEHPANKCLLVENGTVVYDEAVWDTRAESGEPSRDALASAIRKHREATGHEMCWENDEELWSALADGVKLDHTPPPWPEFMTKCAAYRASRCPGTSAVGSEEMRSLVILAAKRWERAMKASANTNNIDEIRASERGLFHALSNLAGDTAADRAKFAGQCVAWLGGRVVVSASTFKGLLEVGVPKGSTLEYLGKETL